MLSNLWEVRQQTTNNEIHWFSCQRGTHPFLESFAALNWEPNYGLQMTSPPHPHNGGGGGGGGQGIFVSIFEKELNEPGNHRLPRSQMKEVLCTKQGPKQTIQKGVSDGCSSMQYSYMVYCTYSCFQHLWWHATGCHLLTHLLFIRTGIKGSQQGSWHGGRMYPVLPWTLYTAVMVI